MRLIPYPHWHFALVASYHSGTLIQTFYTIGCLELSEGLVCLGNLPAIFLGNRARLRDRISHCRHYLLPQDQSISVRRNAWEQVVSTPTMVQ